MLFGFQFVKRSKLYVYGFEPCKGISWFQAKLRNGGVSLSAHRGARGLGRHTNTKSVQVAHLDTLGRQFARI